MTKTCLYTELNENISRRVMYNTPELEITKHIGQLIKWLFTESNNTQKLKKETLLMSLCIESQNVWHGGNQYLLKCTHQTVPIKL